MTGRSAPRSLCATAALSRTSATPLPARRYNPSYKALSCAHQLSCASSPVALPSSTSQPAVLSSVPETAFILRSRGAPDPASPQLSFAPGVSLRPKRVSSAYLYSYHSKVCRLCLNSVSLFRSLRADTEEFCSSELTARPYFLGSTFHSTRHDLANVDFTPAGPAFYL